MTKTMLRAAVAVGALATATVASANVLYFQSNRNFQAGGSRSAFVFGEVGATGTVTGAGGVFNQDFTLNADGFAAIDVTGFDLNNNVVQDRGFRIESRSNVSAYFLSRQNFTTDISYVIDADSLGTDYVAVGYQNNIGFPSQVSAQATRDGTEVTFTPPGGAATVVTLNAGQTYQFTSNEVTGTRVTSNRPIAVFSGNECVNIPSGQFACDHIAEQLPSTEDLSSEFVLTQTTRTGADGNVVRVVAASDNTVVTRDGVALGTIDAGEFLEFRQADGAILRTSRPALVAEYLIGQQLAGELTDPAMSIIPGVDQWLDEYVFATPSGSQAFDADFIDIVIETADLDTLLFDGALVDETLFSLITGTVYSRGRIDVSTNEGVLNLVAASPFLLLATGFQSADSYFTYGGATFSPGASPPPPPPPPPGPVPAPGALALFGLGLLGIALRRR